MRARSHDDLGRIRSSVERTRRLSDKIIGIGPFNLGLDGVLAWIPGAGALYSVAAGGLLLLQAGRARSSPQLIARMAALIVTDSLTDVIPIPFAPAVADMVFTGHKWAADALLKEMDRTLYYPGTRREAEQDPEFQAATARMRSGETPRERVVFLGE
jgi:hypothetical protein